MGWKKEINDLRKRLEFTQNNLAEKVDNVVKKEKLESTVQELYYNQTDPKYVQGKLTESENRSRRNI